MILKSFYTGPLAVNCYVAADEATKKAFVVDPGGHNLNMVNYIKENELEIEYIILTHGHGDHMGGVPDLMKEFPNAKLVACIHDKALLEDPNLNMSAMVQGFPISLTADHYVSDGETMKVGNMELKFLHTPGHTPGGMCITVGDVVFSGDTLFEQSIGRTDFPGSSYDAIIASIRNKLFALPDDTTVLPGHMGPTTIGFEKENNPFV
ncbi:MAG TPA: MBL fold metallo-hydrolase [Anaerovoracaceae bacterium]|nr:MBL fold metallo-hydrolase [Anaerovoracaceae bacterium]